MTKLREHIKLFESDDELADLALLLEMDRSGMFYYAQEEYRIDKEWLARNPGNNKLRQLVKEKADTLDRINSEMEKILDDIGWWDASKKFGGMEGVTTRALRLALLSFRKAYGKEDPLKHMSIDELLGWAKADLDKWLDNVEDPPNWDEDL